MTDDDRAKLLQFLAAHEAAAEVLKTHGPVVTDGAAAGFVRMLSFDGAAVRVVSVPTLTGK